MNFSNPHFAEPRWLLVAFLGPLVLAGLQLYSTWARKRQLSQIAAPHFLHELTRSHSSFRRFFKNALLVLAIAGTGFALARPQWGQQEEAGQSLGEDIVFILDCSRSMDFPPGPRARGCWSARWNFTQTARKRRPRTQCLPPPFRKTLPIRTRPQTRPPFPRPIQHASAILPKLLEEHKLLDRSPGTRAAED